MKTRYKYIALGFVLLACGSCMRDELAGLTGPKDRLLTFTLQLPKSYAAAVGGLNAEQERMIGNLTVLLFETNSSAQEVCAGVIENLSFSAVPGTENEYYTVSTSVTEGTYKFMLLANIPGKISAATTIGVDRETIERSLLWDMTARWDVAAHAGFPMWGISDSYLTLQPGSSYQETILMLRMHARINISVGDGLKDHFDINSILLHNPSGQGRIIPDENNLDRTTTSGYIRATAPTLPVNTSNAEDPRMLSVPWEYNGPVEIEDGAYCINYIYAMESFDPAGRNPDQYAWLEIEAAYKTHPVKSYRVDFGVYDQNGDKTPMPLLRNHTYDIFIDGMNEVEEELDIEVRLWDDARMEEITIDGQYFLKVNQATFNFDRELRDAGNLDNRLVIETNCEGGWEITRIMDVTDGLPGTEIPQGSGWLQVDPRQSPTGGPDIIPLVLEENIPDIPRKAEIHIGAGRLIDYVVTVNQSTDTELMLNITDPQGNEISELTFYDYAGKTQPFDPEEYIVHWSPRTAGYACNVQVDIVGEDLFDFGSGDVVDPGLMQNTQGRKEYKIHPGLFTEDDLDEAEGNPFLQKGARVTYSITDGTRTLSKTIYLRHQAVGILFEPFSPYAKLGTNEEFAVKSNTTWRLVSVDDQGSQLMAGQGNLTPGTSGGNNTATGTTFNYRINNASAPVNEISGLGQAGNKIVLTFEDTKGILEEPVKKTIYVTHQDPNCYMMLPNGNHTVTIPVRKLLWVWGVEMEEEIDPDELTAEILWQHPQPVITGLSIHGTGLERYLSVRSLYDLGNAVVAVRDNTGTIRWSWHLWVSDYYPYDSFGNPNEAQTHRSNVPAWLMLRNLGATSGASALNESTVGAYYQWGRKDPFILSYIQGNPDLEIVQAEKNLGGSIANPRRYYSSPTGLLDWYTNGPDRKQQNDHLWLTARGEKTDYDPCPAGWRVPGYTWTSTALPWDGIGISGTTPGPGRTYTAQGISSFYPASGYYNYNYPPELIQWEYRIASYMRTNHYTQSPYRASYYQTYGGYSHGTSSTGRASSMPIRCEIDR